MTKISIACAFLALTFYSFSSSAQSCGAVKVDCSTHKITIQGKSSTIDCGKEGKTKNGEGKVGGLHSGKIVKDGVDIQSPGMGQSGGGKVFHLPFGGGEPKGIDNSKGCIHVNREVLEQLKKCKGAPLTISGSRGGSGGGAVGSSGGSDSSGGSVSQ